MSGVNTQMSQNQNLIPNDSLPEDQMDKIIKEFQGKPGQLLLSLESLQKINPFNYLPKSVLAYVSKKLDIPISKVYGVATFYSYFNLKPQGKHCITVCRGTACHTKRSKLILENLVSILGIKEDLNEKEKVFLTTENRQFTIRTIACFGQCALAPVCEIDGVIHSHMNLEKLRVLIDQIKKEDLKNETVKQENVK